MTRAERIAGLIASLRQLHEHPRVIRFAVTPIGRLGVWAAASLLLPREVWLPILPLLAFVLIVPRQRDAALALGGLWFLCERLDQRGFEAVGAGVGALLVVGFTYAAYRVARAEASLPQFARRHALLLLHAAIGVALAAVSWLPRLFGVEVPRAIALGAGLWLPFLAWRIGYILLSGRRGSARSSRFLDHFIYSLPAWGGTNVPYGKGHDYLARHRPNSAEDAARAQLAGIKLLVLMWLWIFVRDLVRAGVYGAEPHGSAALLAGHSLSFPTLAALVRGRAEAPLGVAWFLVFLQLIDATLRLAITGHRIVGILRLFGYRVFRNTYKPLLSQSIVEFWNRYYYYFKELLVEFFFFPVYVRHFKGRPRLRIFAATMAAACLGNFYFHVLRDVAKLVSVGPEEAAARLAPRFVYTFLLGLGIFVSMVRERGRRGRSAPPAPPALARLRTARRIAGVWLFFALIRVFSFGSPAIGLSERVAFLASLFGLG